MHNLPNAPSRRSFAHRLPSPKWAVVALGVVLWGTMTLIPLLRIAPIHAGAARPLALSAASLILTLLPLACLIFGAIRSERILYQFLFPLLLLATQFGGTTIGWDDPIQYIPNGVVFALYFVAAAVFSAAPRRITPISNVPLESTQSTKNLFRTSAFIFLPHAVAVLALAISLAVAPAWDSTLVTALESPSTDRAFDSVSSFIPFMAVALAFLALIIHVGSAFQRARELSGYLRTDLLTSQNRWTPTRSRVLGTLLILAVGVAIGLTLVWIR
ncbi:MAG: hypothetical protein HYY84_10565 [Deltaproteobacteria bacterium]|nr:hypothetical protein [Deltaproteobacteria bacterium]